MSKVITKSYLNHKITINVDNGSINVEYVYFHKNNPYIDKLPVWEPHGNHDQYLKTKFSFPKTDRTMVGADSTTLKS